MAEKEKFGFSPETGKKPIEIIDVELTKKENIPSEVKDWMERVETNNTQSNLMNDLATHQPVQGQPAPNDATKLPVTKSAFVAGFKTSVKEAHRWLSEFFLRMIKIKKGKVIFKEE